MKGWPKAPVYWMQSDVGYVSVPFTWNVPEVIEEIRGNLYCKKWYVGGPGAMLMAENFWQVPDVVVQRTLPGVLQRVNAQATKTTTGCPNRCGFCAVPKTEGPIVELSDWPDLPIVCDNNLLAASQHHIDCVFDRLEKHEGVDFNQGIDFRRLTPYIMDRLRKLDKPIIRLACDMPGMEPQWQTAIDRLRAHKIPKSWIRSFVLVGYNSGFEECWKRCHYVEDQGIKALPQWYHPLDATEWNGITEDQKSLGWTEKDRRRLMRYFYQHTDEGE